jgi:hypothetical protein
MLVADFDELDDELKQIDEKVKDTVVVEEVDTTGDESHYKIPDTDDGYYKILKERFGHDTFKEG